MSDVKVAFLTDSCSDIPQELTDKYGIDVIGFHIMLDGKEYLERKDMTNDQFYEMMRQSKSVPTTAAITQLEWVDIYAKYVDAGIQDLVHLCINAGGSSTCNNAVKAAELLEDERPGHKMKIHLIDSHTYSMPYGWYLCECARKVRAGEPLDACLREMQDRLARPIISLNDGISKVEAKVRGDNNVPPAMVKWVKSRVDDVKKMPYMVAYTSSTAKRDELVKLCKKEFGHAPLLVFQLGCVVSANTGPDGIAIVFEGKPRRLVDYAVPLP